MLSRGAQAMLQQTRTKPSTWWPEVIAASVIWLAATIVVVVVAPAVVGLPLLATFAPVLAGCSALGVATAIWLNSHGLLAGAHGGLRLGAAVAVIGQLLDVVLIVGNDGRYPGLDTAGTAEVVVLLLGGYASFVAGSALADRRRNGRDVDR